MSAGTKKQFGILKDLMNRPDVDGIVNSCDSGREGELIFRLVYQQAGCKKPFSRLWLSSMEESAIREGFAHLKPSTEYDALYNAALCRERADWMVGINASRLFSCLYGQPLAVGRVMTPVLAMTVVREAAIAAFVPEKFYTVALTLADGGTASSKRFVQKADAELLLSKCRKEGRVTVQKMERKEKSENPPPLYDLTALQRDANRLLGFTAQQTLDYAQSLYEKRLITYPRTDSRFLTEDMAASLPGLVTDTGRAFAVEEPIPIHVQQVINGSKVTDHHALLVTENLPEGLSQDERAIYEMVAARLLEAFSARCLKDVTTVSFTAGNSVFTAKGTVVRSAGWRAVRGERDEDDEGAAALPPLQPGESFPLQSAECVEKQTKPRPLHTESSLLSAMEHCGRELQDDELRDSLKGNGIGTPATRASIIETLFARDYVRREKKSLVPTDKGLAVYQIVKDKRIADVEMTGQWETALAKIESGEMNPDTFRKGIEVYAARITEELLQVQVSVADGGHIACPKCRSGRILLYPKVAKCSNVDCGLTVFRGKGEKQLTDSQIADLVTKGKTSLIKGFRSREGKPFDAYLTFDKDFRTVYGFPPRTDKPKGKERRR